MLSGSFCPQSIRILATVAGVAITISSSAIMLSSGSARLPKWSYEVSQNIVQPKPPLEQFFKHRFNSDWTEQHEKMLINEIVDSRYAARLDDGPNDVVTFVHANQQEDITLDSPRLSVGAVKNILKKRKT
jgi:hypothetical protein